MLKNYIEREISVESLKQKKIKSFYFGPIDIIRLGIFFIVRRRRNLFLTLTDLFGNVVFSIAASTLKFSRKKRISQQALELMLNLILKKIKYFRINILELVFRTKIKFILYKIFFFLKKENIYVNKLHVELAVPYNGCRCKKKRRL